ncbi:hypothetical protein H8356DRAFT_328228 [Neocallimastix lanati (nom. inval.)]|nr:hypothetical protein H8356DRAFT_328228 [Neocallimastix sp. JGI-2020a]
MHIYIPTFLFYFLMIYSKYEIPNLYFEVFKYFYSNVHKHLLDNFIESNKYPYANI